MPIKTPKFWYRSPSSSNPTMVERLMFPLSVIYTFGSKLNLSKQQTKTAPIPVICIGNITAGGSGKTPVVIALHDLIKKYKLFDCPYFLTRGYGGTQKNPKVITTNNDIKETGDEAKLLASQGKTIISINRYDGALFANDLGADCILMDDGFQNQTLHKDISFIVINGIMGLGNKKMLPAGPLREPIDNALKRAHAIIIIGDDKTKVKDLIPKYIPIFNARIQALELEKLDKKSTYIGFTGLAYPQKFYETLIQNSIKITAFHEFADHHNFSDKELEKIIKEAKINNSKIITTEKDYQRIPKKYYNYIDFLPVKLVWGNEKEIVTFLKKSKICSKSS